MIQQITAEVVAGPDLIGGKAHGLVRMLRLGLPVPPAFVLDTELTDRLRRGPVDGFDEALSAALTDLGDRVGRTFGAPVDPLLVSVRSGAARSMPGMLDTVVGVGRPTGQPRAELDGAVAAVVRSWDTLRARTYRRIHDIDDRPGTAVLVQVMVGGDRDDHSLTGVAFSRDPLTGGPGPVGEILRRAQGPELVSGRRTPQPLAGDRCEAAVGEGLRLIEQDLRQACEVEFTVESGVLWFLQCRAVQPGPVVAAAVAVGLAEAGVISRVEAVQRIPDLDRPAPPGLQDDPAARLGVGIGAGPGVVTGRIATTAVAVTRYGPDVILVRPETSPADLPAMVRSVGLLTARGGLASHAAVVARAAGLPAVVGLARLEVGNGTIAIDGRTLVDGDLVTIDGTTGLVLAGTGRVVVGGDDPARNQLRTWRKALLQR